ncbi:hypothetical protein D9M70_514310 [compost metagenome]
MLMLIYRSPGIHSITWRKHYAMTGGFEFEEELIRNFQGCFELLLGRHDINQALFSWFEKALINHPPLFKNFVRPHNYWVLLGARDS